MREQQREPVNRRSFIRAAVAASTVAVAAVTSPLPAAQSRAHDQDAAELKGRYRESDHITDYYRTNGYETLKE
jgi:hypothetical protein